MNIAKEDVWKKPKPATKCARRKAMCYAATETFKQAPKHCVCAAVAHFMCTANLKTIIILSRIDLIKYLAPGRIKVLFQEHSKNDGFLKPIFNIGPSDHKNILFTKPHLMIVRMTALLVWPHKLAVRTEHTFWWVASRVKCDVRTSEKDWSRRPHIFCGAHTAHSYWSTHQIFYLVSRSNFFLVY